MKVFAGIKKEVGIGFPDNNQSVKKFEEKRKHNLIGKE